MQSEIILTVVICTHKRDDLIGPCLEAVLADPNEHLEVLVVDNASEDSTAQIVAAAAARDERVRYFYEPRLGLSHARNAGWIAARGRFVAYIDDDARTWPGWASEMMRVMEGDGVVAIAGKIVLSWPTGRPKWLPVELEGYFTKLDLGGDTRPLESPLYPFGANMAIRRDVLERCDGFDLALGRHGARSLRSNEEKELFGRIRTQVPRGVFLYSPDAAVDHLVDPGRVRRTWLLRRCWAQGESEALYLTPEHQGNVATLRRIFVAVAQLCLSLRVLRHGDRRFMRLASRTAKCAGHVAVLVGRIARPTSQR